MRKFAALYTHQKQKKAKTWQDGFAHYNSDAHEIVLFDASNGRIASHRMRAKDAIELATEYDVGRFLLTLEEEQGVEVQQLQVEAVSRPSVKLVRRARRPASLIKPIKLKEKSVRSQPSAVDGDVTNRTAVVGANDLTLERPMPVETPTDIRTTTSTAPTNVSQPIPNPATAESRQDGQTKYTVLYTTQKTKKVKAWSDGELAYSASDQRITLRGDDGSTVLKTRIPSNKVVEVGAELDCGRYLIQIEGQKGQEAVVVCDESAPNGLQLQGALKRRHEQGTRPAFARSRPKLTRMASSVDRTSSVSNVSNVSSVDLETPVTSTALAASTTNTALATPTTSTVLATRTTSTAPRRAKFVPPVPHVATHLHFPRRGELLQHTSVAKGYGMGPTRTLVAPVSYADWPEYRDKFTALLRENMMAELGALAMRYYFMARERYLEKGSATSSARGRARGRGAPRGFAQVCKSVGVLLFEGCTVRQAFLDGSAFRAQRAAGVVEFRRGDCVSLELSRREAYAGYARDDTWAISTRDDFPADETFLARSVYFGPNKNNVLELALAGDEDARAAARVFNGEGPRPGKRLDKPEPTVYAIHCLDSGSSWAMLDTIEGQLSPDSMPYLPHLLGMDEPEMCSAGNMSDADVAAVVERIEGIVGACRVQLNLNDEQHTILKDVVMSAASIYLPIPDASATTIVHGPFGTGKSFLIAAIVACLDDIAYEFPEVFGSARERSDDESDSDVEVVGEKRAPPLKVLLASMTNFAVDNMLEALVKQGYERFVRVGSLRRVAKAMLAYVYRSSASAADDIRELETMLTSASDDTERDAVAAALQRMRQQSETGALADAFAVGTTCLSAACAALRGTQFPVVVLDEACQIVEPMALIALASAGCRRLVLVGDPQQLPPTLTTRAERDAAGHGLDRALFSRLQQMGHRARTLTTQYRCHPRIGALCSRLFYAGRLAHGVDAAARPPLVCGVPALAFVDTPGQERQHGKSQSFFNSGEIDVAVQLAVHLVRAGVRPERVGVIALYKTQADMLREKLAATLGARARVQVSTVDAYQGSERDVIIISCVRSAKIGFIANPNRVNVALSRARHHCLILGCRQLLQTDSMWRSIIEYCKADALGLVSAQVLLNRVAAAAVSQCEQEADSDLDIQDVPDEQYAVFPGCQGICDRGVDTNVAADTLEPDLISDSCEEDLACQDNSSNRGSFHADFIDQEGVVGGILSQWSHCEFSGSYPDNDEDDILGCLDVDLDDM